MNFNQLWNRDLYGIAEEVELLPWSPRVFRIPDWSDCDECVVELIEPSEKTSSYSKHITVRLPDLYEMKIFGRRYYVFKWNGTEELDEEGVFDESVPVIIPANLLPKGTELCEDDVMKLKLTVYAHMAVYKNPWLLKLEKHKFEMILRMFGKKCKSRLEFEKEKEEKTKNDFGA